MALREDIENGNFSEGIYFIETFASNRVDSNGQKVKDQIVPCSPAKVALSNIVMLKPHSRLLPVGFQPVAKTYAIKISKDIKKILMNFIPEEDKNSVIVLANQTIYLAGDSQWRIIRRNLIPCSVLFSITYCSIFTISLDIKNSKAPRYLPENELVQNQILIRTGFCLPHKSAWITSLSFISPPKLSTKSLLDIICCTNGQNDGSERWIGRTGVGKTASFNICPCCGVEFGMKMSLKRVI